MTYDHWKTTPDEERFPDPAVEAAEDDGRDEWLDGLQQKYGRIVTEHATRHYDVFDRPGQKIGHALTETKWHAQAPDMDGAFATLLGTGDTEDDAIRTLVNQIEWMKRDQRERMLADAQAKVGEKVRTNYDYPPIPIRSFDWHAVLDNYDGAPDAGRQYMGHGATEEEAVADLVEQVLADREVAE